MKADISFDLILGDEDRHNHFEGCYRLPHEDWKVFYFTRWSQGREWQGQLDICKDVVWPSGITGVDAKYPGYPLTKIVVKRLLAKSLAVTEWTEIAGPDSLQLK